jgi:hypothetical protein
MNNIIYNDNRFKKDISLKTQLQPMDIVKLRNGEICFIAYNTYSSDGLAIYSPKHDGCLFYLDDYTGDLKNTTNRDVDIINLYRGTAQYSIIDDLFHDTDYEYIESYVPFSWSVEINSIKKMTIEEIEKELGYSIEIIQEED